MRRWTRRALSLARARDTFGLAPGDRRPASGTGRGDRRPDRERRRRYLFEELTTGPDGFVISAGTRTLLDKFRRTVGTSAYDDDLAALDDLAARRQLVEAWLTSYTTATGTDIDPGDLAEAVAAELCPDLPRYESDAPLTETVEGLLGTHPRIDRPHAHRPRRRTPRPHTRRSAPATSPATAPTSAAARPWWRPSAPGSAWTSTGRR